MADLAQTNARTEDTAITVRDARREDVPRIVELYRQPDGSTKHRAPGDDPGDAVPGGYYRAFEAIDADPRNRLLVAERGNIIVGTFQLTLLPDMTPDGRDNALVENVVIDVALRGSGLGSQMMRWAIDEARRLGCARVQLTSNKRRTGAHRFYERLGFAPSHEGFRLEL